MEGARSTSRLSEGESHTVDREPRCPVVKIAI